jgi:hypothetical protein
MILSRQGVAKRVPHGLGHIRVESGQDDRPLRQRRHRLHQQQRRPARPGGPRQDHRVVRRDRCRPAAGKRLDDRRCRASGSGCGGVRAGELLDQVDEGEAALPVARAYRARPACAAPRATRLRPASRPSARQGCRPGRRPRSFGARSGVLSSSLPTSRVSCRRRRSGGTAGGNARARPVCPISVRSRIRGKSRAGPIVEHRRRSGAASGGCSRSARPGRAPRASASGMRASSPSTTARGNRRRAERRKSRGFSDRVKHRLCPGKQGFGQRLCFRAGPRRTIRRNERHRKAASRRDQPVPDRVQGKDSLCPAPETGPESSAMIWAPPKDKPGPRDRRFRPRSKTKSPAPRMPGRGLGRHKDQKRVHDRSGVPGLGQGEKRVRPGPDRVGVERVDRPRRPSKSGKRVFTPPPVSRISGVLADRVIAEVPARCARSGRAGSGCSRRSVRHPPQSAQGRSRGRSAGGPRPSDHGLRAGCRSAARMRVPNPAANSIRRPDRCRIFPSEASCRFRGSGGGRSAATRSARGAAGRDADRLVIMWSQTRGIRSTYCGFP